MSSTLSSERSMGRIAYLTSLALVTACQESAPRPLSATDRQLVVDSVAAAMEAYAAAFATLDAEKIVRFYKADPDFRMYADGAPVTGEALATQVRGMMAGLRAIDGKFTAIQVTVLSRDAAVATSPFEEVLTDTAGVATEMRGTVSWTWVREPEGWRIMHGNAAYLPANAGAAHAPAK